jgi:two-component system, NtrC family, nitrogen regulation sensor histidine kinase NtrY
MFRPELHIPQRLRGMSAWFTMLLMFMGTVLGIITFLLLTGVGPVTLNPDLLNTLLWANAGLVFLMALMVLRQLWGLWRDYRMGTPGTGLHIRLISIFSIIAALPAVLVAVFATVTLNRGLDSWFSERTRAIVESATVVAEDYLKNAIEATRSDVANINADLVQQYTLFGTDKQGFLRRVARHAQLRNLSAIYIFDPQNKKVEINVAANKEIPFVVPPDDTILKADQGELVIIQPSPNGNIVRSLIKLQNFPSHYLYVYRVISPTVVDQLVKTRAAKAEYDTLLDQRTGVQLTFALVYALVTLILLLAAIWMGLWFADRLVTPIIRLLNASRQVADGNFNAKVSTIDGPGDLMTLSRTFNMMTDQIRLHRDELVRTNEQLDDRRRFTEAMLAGVSAGVIGIDENKRISLLNRSAETLLGKPHDELIGQPLIEVEPEFADLYEQALARPSGNSEAQISTQINGRDVSFFARMTTETSDTAEHGYVLTFDDITDLVSAQRNSAWSDIARRIAHEIKNPLTPIQLSAERLKRKYLKEIKTDPAVFEQCTDTIIRQVGDLGRIVDEFSSFARMPKAVPEANALYDTVRDATVLQRVSSSDIAIEMKLPSEEMSFAFDRRLITQAITNLVKNAREAVEARLPMPNGEKGLVQVEAGLEQTSEVARPFVRVTDNGIGLPKDNRHRLAEPYMTTREKGTGLGLAIVKRIMEEHGGRLRLEDSPGGQGASVTLEFAALDDAAGTTKRTLKGAA